VLYAVAYQGALGALDMNSGELLWSRDFSAHAGLVVDERAVYLPHTDGEVWALNRHNGEVLWRQPALRGRQPTAPASVGDHIVIGDFAGYIHWLDKSNGDIVARSRTYHNGLIGTPVVVGDSVLMLGRSGRLDALALGVQ